jgi:hypothetical protein
MNTKSIQIIWNDYILQYVNFFIFKFYKLKNSCIKLGKIKLIILALLCWLHQSNKVCFKKILD